MRTVNVGPLAPEHHLNTTAFIPWMKLNTQPTAAKDVGGCACICACSGHVIVPKQRLIGLFCSSSSSCDG